MLQMSIVNILIKYQMHSTIQKPISSDLASMLIETYGSPLYVYKRDIIQNNIQQLKQAAQGYHISYAMKANSNPDILKIIRNNGEGIKYVDVVSPGEIKRALECGYKPGQILYTENFISDEEISEAIKLGVTLNIGALQTLKHFALKLKGTSIFIRVNPDKGAGENYKVITGGPSSKFGICSKDFQEAIKVAKENQIKIIGLHQHIGSNLKRKDREVFIQTTKLIFQRASLFPDLKYINVGGGIGVKYSPTQQLMDIKGLYKEIKDIRDSYNQKLQLWIEPGRFIIANAGFLLCKITAKKSTQTTIFYGTDTGFNHLIRPAMYGSHHQIRNLSPCDLPEQVVSICGNICQSGDFLGKNIKISGKIGDILCIQNAGAYGFVMSSNYNERPRPAEVIIEGEKFRLIRRRETWEDLAVKI